MYQEPYELGIYISLQYHVYEIWPQKIVQKAKPVQSKVLSQPEWNPSQQMG